MKVRYRIYKNEKDEFIAKYCNVAYHATKAQRKKISVNYYFKYNDSEFYVIFITHKNKNNIKRIIKENLNIEIKDENFIELKYFDDAIVNYTVNHEFDKELVTLHKCKRQMIKP